jgi:hypothetical protein
MEADSREHIEKYKRKPSNVLHDDSAIFQSVWIRRNSDMVDSSDWKSVVREFRYVLYCGIVLWTIHIISMAIRS